MSAHASSIAFNHDPPPADIVRGIAFAIAAFVLVALADGLARVAVLEHAVTQVMSWRGFAGLVTVVLLALRPGAEGLRAMCPNRPVPVLVRSVVHMLTSLCWYYAWREIPLADCYAIGNAAPLILTILAIPVLGESVGWRRWASSSVGFAGVLIIVQPTGGAGVSLSMGVLLLGTLFLAITRLMTRILARHDSNTTIVFWMMLVQTVGGLPFMQHWTWPTPANGAAMTFVGVLTGFSHLLLTQAFRLGPVSAIAPYEYTLLLWGTLIGYLIWRDIPGLEVWIGGAIVIAAGLYNFHRERVRAREAASLGAPGVPARSSTGAGPAGG